MKNDIEFMKLALDLSGKQQKGKQIPIRLLGLLLSKMG